MRARTLALAVSLTLSFALRAQAQEAAEPGVELGTPDEGSRTVIEVPAPEPPPPGSPLLDQRWGDASDGRVEPLHAWASFGFFSGRARGGDALVIAPSMGVRLALSEEVDATASWALGYGIASVSGAYDGGMGLEPYAGDVERVEAGNPTLTFSWAPRWQELALRIGVGFALPVAALAQAATDGPSAAQRAASRVVHDALIAMHGGRDPWRFLPERISFFVPVRVAFGGEVVGGAIDAAGGFTLPVLGGGGDVEGVLQLAGEVAVAIVPELRAGLRGSVTAWGLGGAEERVQPALEPWVRLMLGPAFATLRATLALGGDQGLGSEAGSVWAIHVGGGGALERE